jgi:hypothetical protein
MRRPSLAVAVAGTALALSASGGASPAKDVVLAHATAKGRHALATTVADAGAHAKLTLRVTAVPNQRVRAGWVVRCDRVNLGSGRDAQDYSARTPLTRKLRALPWPGPPCKIAVDATLTQSGRVTVELLAD